MSSPFQMKASQPAGSETAPAGSHPAVLVAMIDLGSHEETFKTAGKPDRKAQVRKLLLVWELTAERCAGYNRNHVVGKEFSASFSTKSNLRKLVESWRGKAFGQDEEFDIRKILGKPCLVNLSHATAKGSGNTYAKIESVSAVPKGMTVPPAQLPQVLFEIGEGVIPDQLWLPYVMIEHERKPLADVIKASAEWKALTAQPAPAAPPPPATNGQAAPQQQAPVMTGTPEDSVPF
jgi:hypothetical protein